jgi:hypothetical protein
MVLRRLHHLRRLVLGGLALTVVLAGLLVGGSAGISGATSTTTPLPPTAVTIAQVGKQPDLQATWTPATTGPLATGAVVQLYQVTNKQLANAQYVGEVTCKASCTSAIFRELTFGTLYVFLVWPSNASGAGTPAASVAMSPSTSCATGACVTFDATSTIGAANHAASGILHSVYPMGNDAKDLTALHTTMYRSTPTYNSDGTLNWGAWNVAVASGAQTTLVVADLWYGVHGGQPPTPWSNWSAYSSFITSVVTSIVKSGEQVNYWEPYNEPGGNDGYYSAANYDTETPALLLQQFLVAYNAIKAADPSAAIIGPSLAQWEDYPNEYGSSSDPDPEPDMVSFLNFAAANNLKLAAISWHEIIDNLGPNPAENTLLPVNLVDHVAEARALIAARPSLGNPQIFINEYGMPEVQLIPGWDVAYLAALTNAGVNSAGRSCWDVQCANPSLDGLLDVNGINPWNDYFDRLVYAAMSGNMIATTSTSDFVTALGSYNSSTATVTGLMGRGVGCPQESWCTDTWPGSTLAPATAVKVTVTVPWKSGTAQIALTDISGQNLGPVTSPPVPVDSTATITSAGSGKGTVTFTIPSFLDGDAYGFTITN